MAADHCDIYYVTTKTFRSASNMLGLLSREADMLLLLPTVALKGLQQKRTCVREGVQMFISELNHAARSHTS